MRRLIDAERLERFMRRLGRECEAPGRVYLTGGATAVLYGWRASTVDVDLKLEDGAERILRVLPALKEELELSIELASPADFIPELPGWRERCLFIAREGRLDFFHYDPYAQALSKIERGHGLDLEDVRQMIARGLVDSAVALGLYARIEPELYRYPAIDPADFKRRVHLVLGPAANGE